MAFFKLLALTNSSLTLSLINTFASTAIPIVNTIPAIPGNVNAAPKDARTPIIKNTLINTAKLAT